MDALSKIFDDIHLAKSEYIYLNVHHPYRLLYRHEPSMLAYVILHGQAQLSFEDSDHVIVLQQGDLILLPSAKAHQLHCPNDQELTQSSPINKNGYPDGATANYLFAGLSAYPSYFE